MGQVMGNEPQVIILGSTILAEGLTLSLAAYPEIHAEQIDPAAAEWPPVFSGRPPDVVVYDQTIADEPALLSLLVQHPGILLIALDHEQSIVMLLNSCRQEAGSIDELCQFVLDACCRRDQDLEILTRSVLSGVSRMEKSAHS